MRAAWLACAAVLAGCGAAQARADRFVGQPLPLVVQDLATARPLDPARWRGQVVVVDLWASWCESCKAAMPHHVRLWQRLHARGFSQSELILRMTREEIGSYLGLKLETVSRTFSKFAEDGIVEVKQRHVRILETDALRCIVNPQTLL